MFLAYSLMAAQVAGVPERQKSIGKLMSYTALNRARRRTREVA